MIKLFFLSDSDFAIFNATEQKQEGIRLGHDHLLEIRLLDTRLRDTFLTKSTARHKK
jgi:hypothetical protein